MFRMFSTTSDHHIYTYKGIRHKSLDKIDFMSKKCFFITTMHQTQYMIRATLKRYVKMRHESTTLCTILYQFVVQQIGLQAADTVSLDTLDFIQGLYQIDKSLFRGGSEITNINTRKHNFLSTFVSCLPCLLHQRFNRRITRKTTGIRYSTIRTEITATILDFQEIASSVSSRTGRLECFDILGFDRMIYM